MRNWFIPARFGGIYIALLQSGARSENRLSKTVAP
jgi:hypothetical protein